MIVWFRILFIDVTFPAANCDSLAWSKCYTRVVSVQHSQSFIRKVMLTLYFNLIRLMHSLLHGLHGSIIMLGFYAAPKPQNIYPLMLGCETTLMSIHSGWVAGSLSTMYCSLKPMRSPKTSPRSDARRCEISLF